MKKAQANVVKCAKNKSWVPRNPPPGHLSVNGSQKYILLRKEGLPHCDHLKSYISVNLDQKGHEIMHI